LTLEPRAYSVKIQPGYFGTASIVSASGSDIAGLHAINLSLVTEWSRPDLQGSVSYGYGRLPFDVGLSLFRQIVPGTYPLGGGSAQWVQETVGGTTNIAYSIPGAFDSNSFALSYSVARIGGQVEPPLDRLNPYDTPSFPTRGMLGALHLGWSYSNAQSFLWSVGGESGFSVGTSVDVADPILASDFSGYAASFNFTQYLTMPWLRHHSLALHGGGGASGGNEGGQGPFHVGGFIDLPLVNVVQNILIQGGVQLRGYPVIEEVGRYYGLFNAEYRFPIANIDRGPSTLPLFLNRINGVAFVDYGSAFDVPEKAQFKTGVGGELWFDFTLGYILGFTFRAGYAKGLASGGLDKFYLVAAIPF
jgi:hypothetical protein